jgi:hypothetical protein
MHEFLLSTNRFLPSLFNCGWREKEISAVEHQDVRDLRLSTAAHLSARFSYFSPAGRLPTRHRIVDAGYYENSGCETALDLFRAISERPECTDGRVTPILVIIRYVDRDIGAGEQQKWEDFPDVRLTLDTTGWMGYTGSDASAPPWGLMSVRDAHARRAQHVIHQSMRGRAHVFNLAQSRVPLPLGWMLSGRAAQDMDNAMPLDGEELKGSRSTSGGALENQRRLKALFSMPELEAPVPPALVKQKTQAIPVR